MLLQSVQSNSTSSLVLTSAVAAGGRYDALLRSLWSPAAATLMAPPSGVGVSINVEKLARLLQQRRRVGRIERHGAGHTTSWAQHDGGPPGRLPARVVDVVVCVRGGDGMLALRMQLLASLWAAGIAAEQLPRETPSLTEQYEFAHAAGARWLVVLDERSRGPGGVARVKCLERRGDDAAVALVDLGRFLQLALSGAQDPGRGLAAGLVSGGAGGAAGGGGLGSGAAVVGGGGGSGSATGGLSAAIASGPGHRSGVLHRSGSDTRLMSGAGESLDSEADAPGGPWREAAVARDYRERDHHGIREAGGRHRDRRR